MKILMTGGGTGGHFYPIIAVAQELNETSKENRLLKPELFYMSTDPYNETLLYENNITFVKVSAGKIRRQKSISNFILNFFDLFNTFFGVLGAIWKMFLIYPDVVFGKGGYASFPALFAARILMIPVVIHESDSKPGKVNKWAGKFARRVAVSYPEAVSFFKTEKTAYTGNPIRKETLDPLSTDSFEFFGFDPSIPTILIIGGSTGSRFINEAIMDVLAELVKKYQIIHQTGNNNFSVIQETANVVLNGNPLKNRYKPYAYLNVVTLRRASGIASIVISRAGSTIFEIASWGKPAIIVPIPEPTSHDQRSNAYAYARTGSAVVIEEKNMAPGVLISEIERILSNPAEKEKMINSAKSFSRKDSAEIIAKELIAIGLEHEK
ncbi:MAG: UDP-N-acetylglucosamine--N-acetylmuramyl-(pentapeptide) pyrophosphoryl-undecaprenol N-acetylglucosam [Parcubacteria bacterium C7867-006]|nr:MAG: UDP-N-acetylglucosamine--N-acetylmuramyl-(pentapeptide) pyrophosphoryl-undecaprenol N-acetylglucosam [Parcubacteria bacterium C7867-006]